MKLEVLNTQGASTGKSVELPKNIFGIEPNEHVVWLSVKAYLANQRQGNHKSKERGEIVGSTRKLYRQKGTGSARRGSIKSPILRGGGRVFGPKPRNYRQKVNRKVNQLARRSALSSKAAGGNIIVMEDFSFDAPRTKSYMEILNNLEQAGKKTLMVTADLEKNVYLSSRNIPKTSVARAADLNTYQILHANTLIFSEGAIAKISEIL